MGVTSEVIHPSSVHPSLVDPVGRDALHSSGGSGLHCAPGGCVRGKVCGAHQGCRDSPAAGLLRPAPLWRRKSPEISGMMGEGWEKDGQKMMKHLGETLKPKQF